MQKGRIHGKIIESSHILPAKSKANAYAKFSQDLLDSILGFTITWFANGPSYWNFSHTNPSQTPQCEIICTILNRNVTIKKQCSLSLLMKACRPLKHAQSLEKKTLVQFTLALCSQHKDPNDDTKLHVGHPRGFETVLCTRKENRNVAHCCNGVLKTEEITAKKKKTIKAFSICYVPFFNLY